MKNKLTIYSIITIFSELVWIIGSLLTFYYFYRLLDVPEEDQIFDVIRSYDFLGFKNVPETTLNIIMSTCVLILLISTPLLVMNYKNHHTLKNETYERETGIYLIIAGILSIFSLNIFATVVCILTGITIMIKKPRVKIKFVETEFEKKDIKIKSFVNTLLLFFFLSIVAIIVIVPFYWMILTSLMSKSNFSDYTDMNLYLPFSDMYWINFKEALTKADFGLYIKNTLIVAFTTTIGTVFTTILAAFAFSRLEFKGREMIFTTLLMTMMVPGELYVITNFVTISNTFHWYNTFEALIVPFITDVFYIFFLRQTFKQIPDSLYKAAKVDGCSDLKFLMRVMIPIAMPTLITITILNALGTWNAYVWPRLVTESDHYLVSIALRTSFTNSATQMTDYRLQMAAATIITVPILIVFLFARKYIMRGVGRSGTKG
ncbi:MAG: hypothetical protein K0Q49_210 [Haloplasmataceae bacterium]|nr:hypothetical protein [Haloplasmataceae bacterium]